MTATNYAYGYARASHTDNMDSIPGQVKRIADYYNMTLRETVAWGGVQFDDEPVSASKVPFPKRAIGKKLIELMRPGDHIIFDKVDRVWRSVIDFVKLMEYFKNQGIVVHIKDLRGCSIQMDTPMGNFVLTIMVAIAELESKVTSHRIKEAFEYRRQDKQWCNPAHCYGTKIITDKQGKHRLVWNEKERAVMAEVVRLRDEEDLTWEQISDRLGVYTKNKNRRTSVQRLYRREMTWRRLEIKEPMDMPPGSLRDQELVYGYEQRYVTRDKERRMQQQFEMLKKKAVERNGAEQPNRPESNL